MKGFVLCLFPLLLISCSGMFDSNLFSSIDPPPALDANALSSKSATDLEAMINNDASFMKSLQGNSAALTAVQGVLGSVFSNSPSALTIASVTASGSDPAATKTSVINAAQAYITATTFGSSAGALVTSAATKLGSLSSGSSASSVASAVSSLFAGQNSTQIAAELTSLSNASVAFFAMQTEASSTAPLVASSIDSSTFFGAANKGNLAQTAILAAATNALVLDYGSVANLATALANGTSLTTTGTQFGTNFHNALSSSTTTTSNPYAYVSASLSFIPH